jgi:hypothetical protein
LKIIKTDKKNFSNKTVIKKNVGFSTVFSTLSSTSPGEQDQKVDESTGIGQLQKRAFRIFYAYEETQFVTPEHTQITTFSWHELHEASGCPAHH